MASQTSRPELPWTFGVIDTPEVNAFAAPGGFVLLTRGLYQLLSSDSELAAALGHEISHCVQRDHYDVIHKQEMAGSGKELAMSKVELGNSSPAAAYARSYVEKHGATIIAATTTAIAAACLADVSSIEVNPCLLYTSPSPRD